MELPQPASFFSQKNPENEVDVSKKKRKSSNLDPDARSLTLLFHDLPTLLELRQPTQRVLAVDQKGSLLPESTAIWHSEPSFPQWH